MLFKELKSEVQNFSRIFGFGSYKKILVPVRIGFITKF